MIDYDPLIDRWRGGDLLLDHHRLFDHLLHDLGGAFDDDRLLDDLFHLFLDDLGLARGQYTGSAYGRATLDEVTTCDLCSHGTNPPH